MGKLALLDFDGTIIRKDSLFLFLRYISAGKTDYLKRLISVAPSMLLFKLGFLSNQRAKEILLTRFIANRRKEELEALAETFATDILPQYVYPSAAEKLLWLKAHGFSIYIVSASADLWLGPWCRMQGLALISSTLDVQNGRFTGKLAGENCRFEEKKRRIQEGLNLNEYAEVWAFGDSKDDFPMFSLAQQTFFRPFE